MGGGELGHVLARDVHLAGAVGERAQSLDLGLQLREAVVHVLEVEHRLAELETKVELLRSLVYRTVEEYLAGADVTQLASMAKLTAGRLVREVSDSCLQYWGGMGYMSENPVARMYRDMRLTSIGGGADEVMLQILAKMADRERMQSAV